MKRLMKFWRYFIRPAKAICDKYPHQHNPNKCPHCGVRVYFLDTKQAEQKCSSCHKVIHKNGKWRCRHVIQKGGPRRMACNHNVKLESFNLKYAVLLKTFLLALASFVIILCVFVKISPYSSYMIELSQLEQYVDHGLLKVNLDAISRVWNNDAMFPIIATIYFWLFVSMVKETYEPYNYVEKKLVLSVSIVSVIFIILVTYFYFSHSIQLDYRWRVTSFSEADSLQAEQFIKDELHTQALVMEKEDDPNWETIFDYYLISGDEAYALRVAETVVKLDGCDKLLSNTRLNKVLRRFSEYSNYYKDCVDKSFMNRSLLTYDLAQVDTLDGAWDTLDKYYWQRYRELYAIEIDRGYLIASKDMPKLITKAGDLGLLTVERKEIVKKSFQQTRDFVNTLASQEDVNLYGIEVISDNVEVIDIALYYLAVLEQVFLYRYCNESINWQALREQALVTSELISNEIGWMKVVTNSPGWDWDIVHIYAGNDPNKVQAFKAEVQRQGLYLYLPQDEL